MTEREKRKLLIQKHEGLRLYPYVDTRGHLTIGYGHNLDDRGLTEQQADTLLADDIESTESLLWGKIPEVLQPLSWPRRAVLIDMAFCLGVGGLLRFKRMLNALRAENYDHAAEEILNSEFAVQTKSRAKRLAKIMRTGAYPPEISG